MIEIEKVYTECHIHLREADAKRNHLIAFFSVILGLALKSIDTAPSDLQHVLLIVLTVGGLLTVAAVMHLMKWHILYKNCITYLQDGGVDEKRSKLKLWKMIPCFSTESTMFGLTGVLAFIPIQMLLSNLHLGFVLPASCEDLAVPLNLLGFLILLIIIAFFFVRPKKDEKINEIWIIAGISVNKKQGTTGNPLPVE